VTGDGGVAVPSPSDFTPDTVSDLRNTTNQADLIVIANPLVRQWDLAVPMLSEILAANRAHLPRFFPDPVGR